MRSFVNEHLIKGSWVYGQKPSRVWGTSNCISNAEPQIGIGNYKRPYTTRLRALKLLNPIGLGLMPV